MSDQERNDQAMESSELHSGHEAVPVPVRSAGMLLAARREELGITVERAAEQLKMSPRKIQAIESDNYAAVHGKSIFKGFVRAYAKVLRLDPEPLVALVPEDRIEAKSLVPVIHDATQPFNETRLPFIGRRNGAHKWVVLLILGLVVLIAALAAQKLGWLPDLSQAIKWRPAKQAASASASASASAVASKSSSASPEGGGKEKIKRIELPAVDVSSQLSSAPPAPAPAATDAAPTSPQATESTPATASDGKGELVLKCREKSWVEIRRANGSVLFEKTIPAGGSETITIAEPVQITVGNGAGVDATFRGQPLEIKPDPGSKVVRLSLK